MNITNWFSCKYHLKNNSMPKYFLLNENMIPEWSSTINLNHYELFGNIKIKKDFNQILMLGISNKLEINIDNDLKKIKSNYNIPILKSNLQKCIRRCKVKKSVRTANLLLHIDPNTLLRRIAIIYMEDVIIDNYFNQIIWYMAAVSKGYLLNVQDKILILNIIRNLASSKFKEHIHKSDSFNYIDYFNEINTDILNHNFNTIWSLILRIKYGGMKGDINMIYGVLKLYSKQKINIVKIKMHDFTYSLNLKLKDILLEAVDFHCSNILNILLRKKKLNYFENYQIYKKCIWDFRSSITKKRIINKIVDNNLIDNNTLYESIKDDLNSISKNIIKYQFIYN